LLAIWDSTGAPIESMSGLLPHTLALQSLISGEPFRPAKAEPIRFDRCEATAGYTPVSGDVLVSEQVTEEAKTVMASKLHAFLNGRPVVARPYRYTLERTKPQWHSILQDA
jgi:hypothetical protein